MSSCGKDNVTGVSLVPPRHTTEIKAVDRVGEAP